MRRDIPVKVIFWVTIAFLLILGIVSLFHHDIFFVDVILLVTACSFVYHFRDKLLLAWEGALFLSLGLLMNVSGTFGAYNLHIGIVGWDKLLHVAAASGGAILIYAYLASKPNKAFSPFALGALTFFIILGFGSLNEIIEFTGSRYFGMSQGMLGMANGVAVGTNDLEKFDTQWDMIANGVGALLAVIYCTCKRKITAKNVKRNKRNAGKS